MRGAFKALKLSDRRLIPEFKNIVTRTKNIQPHPGRWNDKAKPLGLLGVSAGVITQEVQQVLREAVSTLNGYLAVDYGQVMAPQQ